MQTPLRGWLLLLLLMPACENPSQDLKGQSAVAVTAAYPSYQEIQETFEAVGSFFAAQRGELKSEFNGKVSSLTVSEGQTVQAGDILFRVEDDKLPLLLEKQRAEIRELEAQLEYDQQVAHDRGAEVKVAAPEPSPAAPLPPEAYQNPGVVPPGPYNYQRPDLPKPQPPSEATLQSRENLQNAKIEKLKAEVALTEKQLANGNVVAPSSGVLTRLSVQEGTPVKAEQILGEILGIDPIDLVLHVPEAQVKRLQRNLSYFTSVPPGDERRIPTELNYLGTTIEAGKTVEARFRVPNPDQAIKVGMQGQVVATLSDKKFQALVVPRGALVGSGAKSYLYVVKGRVAERREVEVGARSGDWLEIKKGLRDNEQIVTSSSEKLVHEQVRIKVNP